MRSITRHSAGGCSLGSRVADQVTDATVTMFRPIGPTELELLRRSEFRRSPARLPGQPIFYPVTNELDAREIAERWNVAESGSGYVTRFEVRRSFVERYEVHRVGAEHHTERWIPAQDLEDLSDSIVGEIVRIRRVTFSRRQQEPRLGITLYDQGRSAADSSLPF